MPGSAYSSIEVAQIETIRLNEEYYRQKHVQSEPAVIAPVRADFPKSQPPHNRYHPYQNSTGTRPYSSGSHSRSSTNTRHSELPGWRNNRRDMNGRRGMNFNRSHGEKCWRCGNVYHYSSDCPAIDKVCRNCGKMGHFQRVCRVPIQSAVSSGCKSEQTETEIQRIAAVEKQEPDSKAMENVSDDSEN